MEAGAIGGVGAGMAMGGAALSGLGGVAATASPATAGIDAGSAQIAGMTPQMQALVDLMQGFSSAEILIALMAAGGGKKKDGDDPFAALVGMAMAGQMARMMSDLANAFTSGMQGASGSGAAIGASLNVTA